jgi:ferric-dicitrate binding protein FerR (iron transport regulator)
MQESEAYNEKLQQWLEGALTEEEWNAFKAANPQELEAYERIADHAGDLDIPESAQSPAQIWNKLEARISSEEPTPVIPLWKRRSFWVAAVAAFLMSLLWLNWPAPNQEVYSALGQTVDHQLPDGSMVVLNADSKIVYQEGDFLKNRQLSLQGEAYFEVESGSRFTVESAQGTVEVLGTAFNVFAHDDQFEVVCAEGKVRVTAQNNEPVILQAGDAVSLQNQKLTFDDELEVSEVLAWQQGTFHFKNATLLSVIAELERQFDYTIQYPSDLNNRLYTGFFTRDSYQDALASVFEPMGLSYQISGKVVVVE